MNEKAGGPGRAHHARNGAGINPGINCRSALEKLFSEPRVVLV